jgi:hypothetical protein
VGGIEINREEYKIVVVKLLAKKNLNYSIYGIKTGKFFKEMKFLIQSLG